MGREFPGVKHDNDIFGEIHTMCCRECTCLSATADMVFWNAEFLFGVQKPAQESRPKTGIVFQDTRGYLTRTSFTKDIGHTVPSDNEQVVLANLSTG